MKVLNNYVVGARLITVYEALAMGRRFGLEFDVLLPSMDAATTGRNDPFIKKAKPYVEKPGHATGMALALLSKDMRLADEMAEGIGAFAPIAKQAAALWTEASEKFGGDIDQVEVARLWEEGSEVTLKKEI
jgi:3-hydroxyisobutyrate dehydrogenase